MLTNRDFQEPRAAKNCISAIHSLQIHPRTPKKRLTRAKETLTVCYVSARTTPGGLFCSPELIREVRRLLLLCLEVAVNVACRP